MPLLARLPNVPLVCWRRCPLAHGGTVTTSPRPPHYHNPQMTKGNHTHILLDMNLYEDHADWIASLGEGVTVGEAERRIGLSKATLRKYMERHNRRLSPQHILKISKEYGTNGAVALVETGYLPAESLFVKETPEEVKLRVLAEVMDDIRK